MPIHIAPHMRSREKMLEQLGLIKTLNSVGYNVQVAEEVSGKKIAPVVPSGSGFYVLGQKIPHSS